MQCELSFRKSRLRGTPGSSSSGGSLPLWSTSSKSSRRSGTIRSQTTIWDWEWVGGQAVDSKGSYVKGSPSAFPTKKDLDRRDADEHDFCLSRFEQSKKPVSSGIRSKTSTSKLPRASLQNLSTMVALEKLIGRSSTN